MYTLNMLAIALELAQGRSGLRRRGQQVLGTLPLHRQRHEPSRARRHRPVERGRRLLLRRAANCPTATQFPMKVRSMVGLIPLFAVETLEPERSRQLPGFKRRMEWFIDNRPDLTANLACMRTAGDGRAAAAVARRSRTTAPHSRVHARRERILSRLRHSRAFAVSPRATLTCLQVQRHGASCGLRARRIHAPDCSAAIPTGAGRSGSR